MSSEKELFWWPEEEGEELKLEKTQEFVSLDEFKKLKDETIAQQKQLKRTQTIIRVTLFAFSIAFVTFITDAFLFHFGEKQKLYDKLEQLEKENINQNFEQIQKQLNDIETILNQHVSDKSKHK